MAGRAAQGDLDPTQPKAALDDLIGDHNEIPSQHNTWLDRQKPQTVDSAAVLLEKTIIAVAAEDIAPYEQSR